MSSPKGFFYINMSGGEEQFIICLNIKNKIERKNACVQRCIGDTNALQMPCEEATHFGPLARRLPKFKMPSAGGGLICY